MSTSGLVTNICLFYEATPSVLHVVCAERINYVSSLAHVLQVH